jgi:hypothetical protein
MPSPAFSPVRAREPRSQRTADDDTRRHDCRHTDRILYDPTKIEVTSKTQRTVDAPLAVVLCGFRLTRSSPFPPSRLAEVLEARQKAAAPCMGGWALPERRNPERKRLHARTRSSLCEIRCDALKTTRVRIALRRLLLSASAEAGGAPVSPLVRLLLALGVRGLNAACSSGAPAAICDFARWDCVAKSASVAALPPLPRGGTSDARGTRATCAAADAAAAHTGLSHGQLTSRRARPQTPNDLPGQGIRRRRLPSHLTAATAAPRRSSSRPSGHRGHPGTLDRRPAYPNDRRRGAVVAPSLRTGSGSMLR